ncbi:PREDICTED: uncharacterized protein LOC108364258 isoform X1 [Rhagoletis zephyria]|uniref:uncharacterized protein LOC108364258 isoform X1 n=2 Tax=Rhagoletis zephyria TaxID=28612 RepID=UPI00081159F5|nr:PREDICTED: uncharacterized protein LOC108364258 isoform X1 [Rhagoletis zephyria]
MHKYVYYRLRMSSTSQCAAKRSRASGEQIERLLDYLSECPGLAAGKFQKIHGKSESDRNWSELAANLNIIGGAVKTVEQWQTVWRDLKSRTSVRVRDRKRQQALTGNRPVNQEPITEVERRVMALIGSEYIAGNGRVVENVPMKENWQLRLEDGDDSVASVLSTTTAADDGEVMCATPRIPAKRTARMSLKRKREDEENEKEMQGKFLEVSSKQADALKLLAECSAANTETNKLMIEAFNRLVDVISSWT